MCLECACCSGDGRIEALPWLYLKSLHHLPGNISGASVTSVQWWDAVIRCGRDSPCVEHRRWSTCWDCSTAHRYAGRTAKARPSLLSCGSDTGKNRHRVCRRTRRPAVYDAVPRCGATVVESYHFVTEHGGCCDSVSGGGTRRFLPWCLRVWPAGNWWGSRLLTGGCIRPARLSATESWRRETSAQSDNDPRDFVCSCDESFSRLLPRDTAEPTAVFIDWFNALTRLVLCIISTQPNVCNATDATNVMATVIAVILAFWLLHLLLLLPTSLSSMGDFTFWLRLLLRLSLSLNFGLSTYLSQKVKWFRWVKTWRLTQIF